MMNWLRYIIGLGLLICSFVVTGQQGPSERFLEVRGTSELDMAPLARATAVLYEGGTRLRSVQTSADGTFSFRLEINKVYTIVLEKEGLVSKRITFITTMPDAETGSWMNEFSMGLVKPCEGMDYSVLNEPVDKVSFDAKRREFLSDKEYVNRIRPRIENMMMKNDQCLLSKYEDAVKKGDQLVAQKLFQEAIASYQKAGAIYPTEEYPPRKIAEVNAILNRQQGTADLFKRTVDEADALAQQQKYSDALLKYKSALRLNPQDTYSGKKISEIESILAQQNAARQAQQNIDDRFNQAMAKASVAYTQKDMVQAKQFYAEALSLKPAEVLPKTRIQEIDVVLAKKEAEKRALAEENKRKADFENDYQLLINQADEQFKVKKFDEARQLYAKALTLKPADPYPAQRVKTIENAVAAQQAALLKSREDGYASAMTSGNRALAQEQFPLARESFNKALTFRPDDIAAKNQLAAVETQEQAHVLKQSIEAQYRAAIANADGYLKNNDRVKAREQYVQALTLKPGDAYAQSKITSIDNATAAEQAIRQKAVEEGYKAAVGAANTAIAQRLYTQAKENLTRALSLKPGDAYASARMTEVDRLIDEQKRIQAQNETMAQQYREAILSADQSYNQRQYDVAKQSYNKALQLKPGDPYALQRIASIDGIQAAELAKKQKQTEEAFSTAMNRGANALISKDYTGAKTAFQEALTIKPGDAACKARIAEVDMYLKQAQDKLMADQARKTKYNDAIQQADQYFAQNNLQAAKVAFEKALEIIPSETYPRQKLNEIVTAMAEQERKLAEKQAVENSYALALAGGEKYFRARDYSMAREEYSRAARLKPDESIPRQRIAEIDNLLRIRQQEQDAAKTRADAYAKAMNAGNTYFNSKQYLEAKGSFNEALKQMPGDALANEQIMKIEYILAEADRLKQAEAQRKASYDSHIKAGDNAYESGSYAAAKESYKKALSFEPNSVYAKQKIDKIEDILRTLSKSSVAPSSTSKPRVVAAIPMTELVFKTESDRQRYLDELIQKYPSGITLEKYKEPYKEIFRYIVIRENIAQEFRQIVFTTYSGTQFSVNGKPITQQYFLSQTKARPGEAYQVIDMQ
jgi:tetratricopeptide (TPR) repeat protein